MGYMYPNQDKVMKRSKRTPEQREAIRIAFWQKWAGTMPVNVTYTNCIIEDEWYNSDITKACDESHIKSV